MSHRSPLSPEARAERGYHERRGRPVWERAWIVTKRVFVGIFANGFMYAGNLAYLALLTVFPFFILAAAIASVFGQRDETMRAVNSFLYTLPHGVADILRQPIRDVLAARTGSLLLLGALVGLWSVGSFVETIRDIFRRAYGVTLDKPKRVLRALLWAKTGRLRRATYISSRIGIAFSWLLIVAGVAILLTPPHAWGGFSFLLIGFFLKSAAESGYANAIQREILGGVRVRDLMTANPASISDSLPLNLAVEDYFLTGHHVAYPVCASDGEFRGLLRLDFLKDVPKEKWPYISAGDVVAEKSADSLRIGVNESAARAMRLLLAPELSRLAVIENGKLVGIVTRHDILHFIEIHTELED